MIANSARQTRIGPGVAALFGFLLFFCAGCATGRKAPGPNAQAVGPGLFPASPAYIVHVAPTGDDGNPGTAAAPLATLQKARDTVRAQRASGVPESGPAVIQLHSGIYRITETLVLTKEDSGSEASPVIWTAAQGTTVRFIGGTRLNAWRPIGEDARKRLPESARDNVLEADLPALGVNDFGGVAPGVHCAQVFLNGRYLTLARYPNEGFVRIADVPEEARMARPIKDPRHPTRDRHDGPFNYAGDRPERWADATNVWVHGYWCHDWSDQYHEVLKFDCAKKELWPKPPYHTYGYKKDQRYYYLNILEELDAPGEWFLDRDNGKLYLWPPAPLADAEILFPELEKPMIALEECEHISIRGIVFECSRAGAIVIKGGSHCDVSGCTVRNVGGTAVDVKGGTHHTVRGCDIYEVATRGIGLNGGDRKTLSRGDHVVENCHIHHFARIEKTYRPAVDLNGVGNRISHCYIHDCPHQGIGYSGNDHVIEFTEFTRIAQETGDVGAIYTYVDWSYMGHVVRHNYFHHIHGPGKLGCSTVYPDLPCGGMYLYGNIFYDVDRIFHTNSGRGMVIENNIFLKDRSGISFQTWHDMKMFRIGGSWRMVERLKEIEYDQPPYSTRYPVLRRLAEDFAKGDEQVYERAVPKENVVRRNISAGESSFLSVSGKGVGLQYIRVEDNYIADPIAFRGSPDGEAKTSAYRNDDEQIRGILGSTGNIISPEAPGFVDPGNGDFRLKPGAPAAAIGFEPIPFDQIGLRLDAFRQRLPEPLPRPPAEPVLIPEGGFFTKPVKVAFVLPRGSAGAELHYTLDGNDPSRESPVANGPLRLTASTTVKCAAFSVGESVSELDHSQIVAATYHIAGRLADGIFLSDLPVAVPYIGYEPVGLLRDIAHENQPLRLGGKTYAKGLITHPDKLPDGNRAVAEFALTGPLRKAGRFTATIGIEDQAPTDKPDMGTCAFAVELLRDGTWQRVYESPVLKAGGPQETVDLDIAGARCLRLVATDGGDGISWDHAVWGNPLLK